MEDSEAVATAGMGVIVAEFADFGVFRAHVHIKRGSNGRHLQIVPIGVPLGACAMVASNDVIWVSDPDACWALVSVEKTVRFTSVNDQVVLDQIIGLNGIFNEHGVAHRLVVHVARDLEIVDAVEGRATIVGLVDRVLLDVRLLHSADHVEVDRVPAKHERLANVREFAILDPAHHRLVAWRVKHDMGTVLVGSRGLWVAPIDYVSGEKANFGPHDDRVRADNDLVRKVCIVKRLLVEPDDRCGSALANTGYEPHFRVGAVIVSRSDDNLFTDLPIKLFASDVAQGD